MTMAFSDDADHPKKLWHTCRALARRQGGVSSAPRERSAHAASGICEDVVYFMNHTGLVCHMTRTLVLRNPACSCHE